MSFESAQRMYDMQTDDYRINPNLGPYDSCVECMKNRAECKECMLDYQADLELDRQYDKANGF